MKEDIKYQKFKKVLKYAILFVLGCIMIYSCNIGEVSALTIGSGSIYSCNASDTVVNSTYSYLLDGDFYNGYLGTTYQGVMQGFNINFNAAIQQGNTYTLDLYANTGDWRNISSETIQVFGSLGSKTCSNNVNAYTITSVSATYYKITITFISNSTASYSQLSLANLNGNPLTGITNWKIDSLVLTDYGNSNTSDIIDNQNKQTETIIQNDKENTQNIIDNQNKNNEELKDSIDEGLINCYNNYLDIYNPTSNTATWTPQSDSSSVYFSATSWKDVVWFITLEKGKTYTFSYKSRPSQYIYLGLREVDSSGNQLRTIVNDFTGTTYTFTMTQGSRLQFFINNSQPVNNLLFEELQITDTSSKVTFTPFNKKVCTSKLDSTNDKLDNLTGAITDSSSPDTSGLSNAAGWLPPGPVDSLLTLPINLLNSLLGNLESTCNPINLTLPFVNKSFTIPCPNEILNNFGDNFMTFFNWFGAIAGCWCLYKYFINLYKWVEIHLSMDEKESLGKWGGV